MVREYQKVVTQKPISKLPSNLVNVLTLEEDTLVVLQAYNNICMEIEKRKNNKPDLSVLRSSLFWDTDINKIDWENQYKAVIRRVFERGNEQEKHDEVGGPL